MKLLVINKKLLIFDFLVAIINAVVKNRIDGLRHKKFLGGKQQ